jgi:hypothetical protein
MGIGKLLILAWIVGAFVLVPAALADSSTVLGGYGSNAAQPVVQVKGAKATSKTSAAPVTATSGTLPFTGSDLTLFVVGGVLLVGLGIGLRRMKPDDK